MTAVLRERTRAADVSIGDGSALTMTTRTLPVRDAGFRTKRYGPGESVLDDRAEPAQGRPAVAPGDFILTHGTGLSGALIHFGEALRYRGAQSVFAHWTHTAIFINSTGDLIEAVEAGVQQRNVSVYGGTEYVVVRLPEETSDEDRQHAVAFAQYCLDDSYSWLTIVSIGLVLLTGGKLSFGIDGQQICSTLVAQCIERIGMIFTEGEPWQLMPADLAKQFDAREIGDKGTVPDLDSGVERFSRPGGRRK